MSRKTEIPYAQYETLINSLVNENNKLKTDIRDSIFKLHLFMTCNTIIWWYLGHGSIGITLYLLSISI